MSTMFAAVLSLRKRGRVAGRLDTRPLRRAVTLDPARLDAYARVCGFTARQGVPLTYPYTLAFPLHVEALLRPAFPFPVIGLIHLDNQITQHARLHSGDALEIEVALGCWLAHPKGQAVSIETRIVRGGMPVWDSTSTYLSLGAKRSIGDRHEGVSTDDARLVTTCRWTLPADLGRRYARISGDANPIHTSRVGARLLGLPRPIAHGMWSKARALADLLPQSPVEQATARVAFKSPVLIPGAVTLLVAPGRTTDPGRTTVFELRDRGEIRPNLRGELRC